jgi:hypothetical protein
MLLTGLLLLLDFLFLLLFFFLLVGFFELLVFFLTGAFFLAGAFFEVDFLAGTGFFFCANPSGATTLIATKMVKAAVICRKNPLKRIKY